MVGVMNDECSTFRPLLAEHLMLGLPLPEELTHHLDRCPDCAREAVELGAVVRTLRRSDPSAVRAAAPGTATDERPSRELGDRIRRDVAEASAPRRLRPRRITAVVTAAAVAASVAVAVPLVTRPEQPPVAAVALVRDEPMISHPWGTEVPVSLSGLEPGRTYTVMAVNADGVRASGGTVRAVTDDPVSAHMITAMPKDTITALVVEDDEGRAVLHVPVRPLPAA